MTPDVAIKDINDISNKINEIKQKIEDIKTKFFEMIDEQIKKLQKLIDNATGGIDQWIQMQIDKIKGKINDIIKGTNKKVNDIISNFQKWIDEQVLQIKLKVVKGIFAKTGIDLDNDAASQTADLLIPISAPKIEIEFDAEKLLAQVPGASLILG